MLYTPACILWTSLWLLCSTGPPRCSSVTHHEQPKRATATATMGTGYNILAKLVRNDAMKVDPPEIYNLRVLLLACASCFGGTLFGMDIGIIGGVITVPAFKK